MLQAWEKRRKERRREGACKILVGKPEEKVLLGGPRGR
jgi:hypothetical protein